MDMAKSEEFQDLREVRPKSYPEYTHEERKQKLIHENERFKQETTNKKIDLEWRGKFSKLPFYFLPIIIFSYSFGGSIRTG